MCLEHEVSSTGADDVCSPDEAFKRTALNPRNVSLGKLAVDMYRHNVRLRTSLFFGPRNFYARLCGFRLDEVRLKITSRFQRHYIHDTPYTYTDTRQTNVRTCWPFSADPEPLIKFDLPKLAPPMNLPNFNKSENVQWARPPAPLPITAIKGITYQLLERTEEHSRDWEVADLTGHDC